MKIKKQNQKKPKKSNSNSGFDEFKQIQDIDPTSAAISGENFFPEIKKENYDINPTSAAVSGEYIFEKMKKESEENKIKKEKSSGN